MTRSTNARIAGGTYLVYMAAGIAHQILMHRAIGGEGTAARLARFAAHATDVRTAILFSLVESFSAIVLAVTFYGITRIQDNELAILAMACRVAEGVIGALAIPNDSALLWLARSPAGARASELAAFLLLPNSPVGAIFFAVGTGIFAYLLLRGRMIPVALAWLGLIASALLAAGLPLQVAGFPLGPLIGYLWLPAIAYAVVLALWLLIRGVR